MSFKTLKREDRKRHQKDRQYLSTKREQYFSQSLRSSGFEVITNHVSFTLACFLIHSKHHLRN